MGFAGFMGDIEDEQERERQAADLIRIFERHKRCDRLYPEVAPGTIVAVCEKCGEALTMGNWWKIGGKNLCEKHGKAYAEYLKS